MHPLHYLHAVIREITPESYTDLKRAAHTLPEEAQRDLMRLLHTVTDELRRARKKPPR